MGQASHSHSAVQPASVANKPTAPRWRMSKPPTAPPAKNPSDCSVL
ncbi:MAG: hypothetical protein RLZ34_691, partial [Pseudomonadota bacterium]